MNHRDYILKNLITQLIGFVTEWTYDSNLSESQFNRYVKIKIYLQKIYVVLLTDQS